jgi:hypothetical protein
MLTSGRGGIFTLGDTSTRKTGDALTKFAKHEELKRNDRADTNELAPGSILEKKNSQEWTWNQVQGAEGWWQIFMQGIWVDNKKVLDSQPIILDVGYRSPASKQILMV